MLAIFGLGNPGKRYQDTRHNIGFIILDYIAMRAGIPFKSGTYTYMGTYDSQGVPDYLEPVNDVIDAGLLQNINNALPENQPVPDFHPEYLAAGNQTSLSLLSEADVWVTFVHEGAGYKNVLGYFTYTTGSPPATLADVDSISIVFPNDEPTPLGTELKGKS